MINFTNRDYNTIRKDLINQLKSMTDKWNDTNESDASMIFINTLAGISAMLNFYIDKQCNEAYINLAKEDKNVLSLLELLNYKRPLRVPARATQVFEKVSTEASSPDTVNSIDINLPKYTSLSSSRSGNISYMLNEPLIMGPTETYKEVEVIQGSRQTYIYTKKDIIGYKLHLPKGGISEEDFKLLVDNSEWEKCDNAFLKYRGGRYYSVYRDPYDSHYILLSCDFENYIYDDSKIEVQYINCLGEYTDPPNTVVSLQNNISNLVTYNKDYFTGGFTEDDVLLDEEVGILNNLRNFVKGPFVIIKHQKNGSIFMDSQNKLYLVKGIKSPIERMSELEVTPTICDTFIFQFKDSIIYSSIIFPSQIRIVGNMKREYLNIYNKNKNKIIKRIV